MTKLITSVSTSETIDLPTHPSAQQGSYDGRPILLIDPSYQDVKDIKAGGVDGKMDDFVYKLVVVCLVTAALALATIAATVAVAITTRSFKQTAIVFGVGTGVTLLPLGILVGPDIVKFFSTKGGYGWNLI